MPGLALETMELKYCSIGHNLKIFVHQHIKLVMPRIPSNKFHINGTGSVNSRFQICYGENPSLEFSHFVSRASAANTSPSQRVKSRYQRSRLTQTYYEARKLCNVV